MSKKGFFYMRSKSGLGADHFIEREKEKAVSAH